MTALDQAIFAALAQDTDTNAQKAQDAQKFADDLATAQFTPANDWDAFEAQLANLPSK